MRLAFLTGAALLTIAALRADADPPTRVARLNYLSGEVSFQPGGVDDWVEAPLNRPLTGGDHIWTEDRARAELHIGSTAIRAGGATGLSFLNLDDRTVQIRLSQGSLQIHLRRLGEDETFEVDTPNLAFSLLRPGTYRIDVNPNGDSTLVTVRGGEGEGTGGGQAFPIHVRQQARVSGMDSMSFDLMDAPAPDAWDNWCQSRDRREEQAQSARYVSREVIGYEDLDEYGAWRQAPEYGMVWYPRTVPAGWAPYHNGHWAWVDPWGWTWVDDAPWGFAPFHYGRWAYVSGSWGWIPGPVVARPVYAPALVAWVGGAHFSLSVSVGGGRGGVAWFPLGPGDVYVPAYRTSPRYFSNVNTSNTTVNNVNITKIYNTTVVNNTTVINNNTYVNRGAPGAVTAVPQDSFVRSRPVAQAAVALPANVQTAPVSYAAQVAPVRQSVLGANAPAAPAGRPPQQVMNREVVAKAVPPARPVPFAMKQEALQANPGRPLAAEAAQQLQQRNAPAVRPLIRQAPTVQARQSGSGSANPRTAQPVNSGQRDTNRIFAPLASPQAAQPTNATPRLYRQPASPQANPRVAQPAEGVQPTNTTPRLYQQPAGSQANPRPNAGQREPDSRAVPQANPRVAQPAEGVQPTNATPRLYQQPAGSQANPRPNAGQREPDSQAAPHPNPRVAQPAEGAQPTNAAPHLYQQPPGSQANPRPNAGQREPDSQAPRPNSDSSPRLYPQPANPRPAQPVAAPHEPPRNQSPARPIVSERPSPEVKKSEPPKERPAPKMEDKKAGKKTDPEAKDEKR